MEGKTQVNKNQVTRPKIQGLRAKVQDTRSEIAYFLVAFLCFVACSLLDSWVLFLGPYQNAIHRPKYSIHPKCH